MSEPPLAKALNDPDMYRLIAENAYDLVAIIDSMNYEYKYLSPSHSKIEDYDIEKIIGKKCFEHVHPEDYDRVVEIMQSGIKEGRGTAEYRWEKKEGLHIWLESIGKMIKNQRGEDEILLVSWDITQRKNAEEALMRSEERYRLIVDNAYEGIAIIDPNTYTPIFVNPALTKMLGYSLEELREKDMFKLVHHKDLERLMTSVQDGIKVGNNTDQYRCRRKDGTYLWLETNGKIIEYEGEEKWFCVSRDISGRKNAEEKLRKQIDYQDYLMNNINELFYTYNRELRFTYVNQKTCETLVCPRSEIVGKSILDFIQDKEKEKVRQQSQLQLDQGIISDYEQKIICFDGREKLLRVKGSPIIEDGQITGGQVMAEDITNYRKMENEMVRLAQLHTVGEIAAGIGHEIRNPMTTVKGFLQIMSLNPELLTHKHYFDIMLEEMDRANSIITEFLSLAKNKIADLHIRDLNSVINAIFPLLQADALLAEKVLVLDLKEIPQLWLDEKEIRQLIINLVRNGLEAINTGDRVCIRTYQEDDKVVLAVMDQGKGIDSQIKDKLGTPFITTKEDGTGLGLSICYSIARRHNAVIDVQSGSLGTTFAVIFRPEQG